MEEAHGRDRARFFRAELPDFMRPKISVMQSTVRKVCQLTGETDRERNIPAFNRTESNFGLVGTDRGSSFEHGDRLWFLFGDTVAVPPRPSDGHDSVAWTTATQPGPGISLQFSNSNKKYTSPRLLATDGSVLDTSGFDVPVAGLSANGQMYIIYTTDRIEETSYDNGLDAFWIGPDNGVGSSWANPLIVATNWANPQLNNGAWHSAFPVTHPGVTRADSSLAALSRLQGALDVFWIGPDGTVTTTWANPQINNGAWNIPFGISLPGAVHPKACLSAVTRFQGALDVFWAGPDGSVVTNWANPQIDDGRWHAAFPITAAHAANAAAAVSAVTRHNGFVKPNIVMGRSVFALARNGDPTDLQTL